jgi:hypothetical protein
VSLGEGSRVIGSIIYDNASVMTGHDAVALEATGDITVTASCIEGESVWPGAGNINADPLLVARVSFEPPDGHIPVDLGDPRLSPGSPCIDLGSSEGMPSTDVEGHGRPCGEGGDMGAYELGDCPGPQLPFLRGDANSDGATDLSDAVSVLDHLFLGEDNVPCLEAGDSNDDGAFDVSDAVYILSFLFLGGKPIGPPVGTCGVDPTGHSLPCDSFPACP